MNAIIGGLKGIGVLIVLVAIAMLYVVLNISFVLWLGEYFRLQNFDEFLISVGITAVIIAFIGGAASLSK